MGQGSRYSAAGHGQWANRTDDLRLRVYTVDVAARAYAAYAQCTEIDEAARLLGDAGDIAASHSLEANTAGQYAFLETHTGATISDALADLLAGGAS